MLKNLKGKSYKIKIRLETGAVWSRGLDSDKERVGATGEQK